MDSMKCWDCAMKHLSAARSYGTEVMGGHDHAADLNHCVDLSGELVNAEHHLTLLGNPILLNRTIALRYKIKAQRWVPKPEDLEEIKNIWEATLITSEIVESSKPILTSTQPPDGIWPRLNAQTGLPAKKCGGCAKRVTQITQPNIP